MLPVLINLGFIKIYTFGVFLVLGFFWGLFLLWRNIRLTSLKEEEVFDTVFISIIGGLFFSRLFYVLLNFSNFGFDLLKFILINGYPGLSIYGFIFGFFLTVYFYTKKLKINFNYLVDYFIGSLFLSLIFGKIGGFFSGDEVGTVTKFFLKTKYLGLEGERHLVGLYQALLFGLGFYLSQKLIFEVRKEKYFKGFVFVFGLFYFSFVYLITDKLRVTDLYIANISFNYLFSLIFFLTMTIYFVYYFRSQIILNLKNYGKYFIEKINRRIKKRTVKR